MKNRMKKLLNKIRNSNLGFTLVELIIVIAIIAVLTAVLAPQYIKYVDNSRWATDQNNAATLLHEVQVAIVDVQAADGTVSNDSITFTASGVSALSGNAALDAALDAADPNWDKIKVQNKGSATGAQDTYTINITANGATGAWS